MQTMTAEDIKFFDECFGSVIRSLDNINGKLDKILTAVNGEQSVPIEIIVNDRAEIEKE